MILLIFPLQLLHDGLCLTINGSRRGVQKVRTHLPLGNFTFFYIHIVELPKLGLKLPLANKIIPLDPHMTNDSPIHNITTVYCIHSNAYNYFNIVIKCLILFLDLF